MSKCLAPGFYHYDDDDYDGDDYNDDDDDDDGYFSHHSAVVLVASLYAIVATENTKSYVKSKFVCMDHEIKIWLVFLKYNVITSVASINIKFMSKLIQNPFLSDKKEDDDQNPYVVS